MKKVIVAFFLVTMCFGSVVHAASFTWSAGATGVNPVGFNGSALPIGTTILVFWDKDGGGLNALTTANKATWLSSSGGVLDDSQLTTASSGVIVSKTYSPITWNTSGDTVWNSTLLPGQNSGSQTFYALIIDSSSVATANHYYLASKTVTAPTSSVGPLVVAFGSNLPTTAGQWTTIPEPTSLALLGIGLAAIGLRRRFMKK